MSDSPTVKRSALAAFRHRDFTILWFGSILGVFGGQFTTVATAWQLYELTSSALQLGLLGLARGLPQVGFLLFGGMLADAMDRRRLMQITQAGQFVVAGLLVGCTVADVISPAVLYGCNLLLALFTSLETPARQAIVPNLVPRADLTNALALNNSQRQVGMIVGPSVAGIVLAAAGAAPCYAVDALARVALVVALQLMQSSRVPEGGRRAPSLQSLGEGLHFVWTHPVLLCMMVLDFGQNFFSNPRALLPIYARDILVVGPEGLGLLYAASSAGALVMAVLLSVRLEVRRAGIWVLVGVFAFGVSTAVFGISHLFWLSLLMLAVSGGANAVGAILRGTITQLATPDDLRGRVTGVNSTFTMSGPQLGQFQAGVVAEAIGPESAVLAGGVIVAALAAGMGIFTRVVRRVEIGSEART